MVADQPEPLKAPGAEAEGPDGLAVASEPKGRDRASRIASLLAIGVDVLACDATLQTLHLSANDVISGVRIVPNGLPAIVELEVAGWYYVRP